MLKGGATIAAFFSLAIACRDGLKKSFRQQLTWRFKTVLSPLPERDKFGEKARPDARKCLWLNDLCSLTSELVGMAARMCAKAFRCTEVVLAIQVVCC